MLTNEAWQVKKYVAKLPNLDKNVPILKLDENVYSMTWKELGPGDAGAEPPSLSRVRAHSGVGLIAR